MKIACIHTSNVSYYELKDLFTKTELEMTNGMVAKAERNNKYDIRLNPKCE